MSTPPSSRDNGDMMLSGVGESRRASKFLVMCCALGLGGSTGGPLLAADKEHLAMLANALAVFDRVDHMIAPPLADASACVQTQAAMLAVALPGEESELHYRKGYCELAV